MAIASLVLGILAIILSLTGAGGIFAVILGIIGIILGVLGRKDPERKGMATAGLVMSIISVALGILLFVACAGVLGAAGVLASSGY